MIDKIIIITINRNHVTMILLSYNDAETVATCVRVCFCQTKVTKLVVQIGGTAVDAERQQTGSGVGGPETPITSNQPAAASNLAPRDKLVRVCSWSDRRDSGGGGGGGAGVCGGPRSSIAESADDVHMPSVKELAKQFSSSVSTSSLQQ